MTPNNIRYFASYFDGNSNGRVIHFGPTEGDEKLLEVPLGKIEPQSTLVITVGMDKSRPNVPVDSDILIGVSDGTFNNVHRIQDVNNYLRDAPCFPINGTHDNYRVSANTSFPATVKLIFTPFYKYTACETFQEGGYINTGTFNDQIDTTKPLSLRVFADDDSGEQYFVYYIKVEYTDSV